MVIVILRLKIPNISFFSSIVDVFLAGTFGAVFATRDLSQNRVRNDLIMKVEVRGTTLKTPDQTRILKCV